VSTLQQRRVVEKIDPAADGRRRLQPSDFDLIRQADHALDLLQGKWKVHLLVFMARGVHRPSRLLDCLPGASKKMMIDTLRALARDGIVERRIFAEVPVRVEYSLTPLGWSLSEPLVALAEWSQTHDVERVGDRRWRRGDSPLERPAA
jgi:DNA-binding HxlR family transcriptional regulator